jgi:hypothetical protein
MAYHKGDVQIDDFDYDAREDDGYDETNRFVGKKVIELPHSCDSWIIGGKEEAKEMIKDLQEIIKVLPHANQYKKIKK